MKWIVWLSGTASVLEELSQSVNSSSARVVKEDGGYSLESDRFLGPDDQVRSAAEELLALLGGAARLTLGVEATISIVSVAKLNADGTREEFITVSDDAVLFDNFSVTKISRIDGSVEVSRVTDPIPRWLDAALSDSAIATVLRLQALPLDWVNLYRVLEVIEADVGGSKRIRDNGWATSKALERFARTANSPSVIGDEARHGREKYEPPAHPMHIGEAPAMITSIAHQWLNSKLGHAS